MKRIVLLFLVLLLSVGSSFAWGDTLDFRVNTDAGKREQNYPAIAASGRGRVIVVWRDYRDSTSNYDIFAQYFDSSGARIKKNFKVNDDANLAQQNHPDVAMDRNGNFLVVWEDMRNETQGDIYAELYDSLGNKIGINFKVNEDVDQISQHDPSVAADGFGRYVVSWTDFREGSNDIYAQRLSSSVQFINDNFKVNDDLGNAQQHSCCVAMDYYGNFIIAWYDNRNGNDDIYAQRFDSSGAEIDTNFKVNQDQTTTSQRYPQVDMDNKGDFVIAWCDTRKGNEDIYLQRFGSDGLPIDTNLKVNTDASSSSQRNPSVAMDGWGDVIVAWQDYRDSTSRDYDIYAQKYDNLGNSDGPNYRVNSDTLKAIQAYPKVATDGDYIYFTWTDKRILSYDFDIYARFVPWLVNASGEIALSSSSHNFGDVDSGTSSNWEFQIHNIGKQSLTVDSITSTNSVFATANPSFPQAIPRDDSLIVTVRFSPLVGHFYQGSLFIYNSDPESPAVQVKLSGWGYPHTDEPDSFSLMSPLKGARVYSLPLSLVWEKSFPADPNDSLAYTLWYGTDSSFSVKNEKSGIVDTQYVITDSLTEDAIYYWKVKAEDSFGLYIWSKETDWYWLVNLSNQPPKSFGLILPKDQDTIYTLLPTFVWHSSSDDDILDTVGYSLYYDTLSGFSTTRIKSDIADTFYTLMDSLKENRVYYWKVKAKDIAGLVTVSNEIWSLVTPEGTGVGDEDDWQMPETPILMQNYPNPFNSETKIRYFLNREAKTSITIYNLLGQKMKEYSSYQSSGWKQISWDGKDQNGQPASSGIYFYELKTNQFRSIKKMTLVK
jgi:hypothetical protein